MPIEMDEPMVSESGGVYTDTRCITNGYRESSWTEGLEIG